MDAFKDMI